jgi:hypothetical protein
VGEKQQDFFKKWLAGPFAIGKCRRLAEEFPQNFRRGLERQNKSDIRSFIRFEEKEA